MSRINLEPKEPGVWVTVGWDPPLQTFYAQVFRDPPADDPDGDDEQIVWEGFGGSQAIHNINTVRELVLPYVTEFPDAVARQLMFDRARQQ